MVSLTALKLSICLVACATVQDDFGQYSPEVQSQFAPECGSCGELPSCSFCTPDCNVCPLPECGVCGQNQCWDCSGEEGIDVDSLTDAAQSKKLYEASMARIVFKVPEDAGVFLLDQRMSTLGEERSFLVSVNDQSKVYKYEVKVDVVRGGKKYFKKLKIADLRAGMILDVAVEAPPVADGEPGQIKIEPKARVKGGKPAEEKDADKDNDTENSDDKSASLPIPELRR
jgi:hypothetical protein